MADDSAFTTSLSENLITVLCHSDSAGKIVSQLVKPEEFEGDYRIIADRAISYWKKHKVAPKVHTPDLFADILDDKGNRKRQTYQRILRSMLHLAEGMNTDYIIEQVNSQKRLLRMKDVVLQSAELLNSKRELALSDVEQLWDDLRRARQLEFDLGLRLTEFDKVLTYFETHYSEFRLGIEPLDKRGIVPARGEAMIFLAPTGRGKTWFLCHVGKHALMQRKKVLHVTLEIDAEPVAQRYYQMLFSMTKRPEDVKITRLKLDKEKGTVKEFSRATLRNAIAFTAKDIRKHLSGEVKKFEKRLGNVIIKRFAQRSLTMAGLNAYLDSLEAEGWVPDIVILDYIGITATDVKNPRSTLGRAFEDFRGIMQTRNMAGVTAHQTSKVGMDAKEVKVTHTAEDISLIFTSDIALTYSSTKAEEALGLARIGVGKARHERDKFEVIITQSYARGQFVLQAARMNKVYREYMKPREQRQKAEAGED